MYVCMCIYVYMSIRFSRPATLFRSDTLAQKAILSRGQVDANQCSVERPCDVTSQHHFLSRCGI